MAGNLFPGAAVESAAMNTTAPAFAHLRLDYSHDAEVARVTFTRPEKRNPLSFALVEEILAVLDRIEADERLRVVVLRGTGGSFCSGGDIRDLEASRAWPLPDAGPDPIATTNRTHGMFLVRLRRLRPTVISAVDGVAVGGGVGMICASDIVIGTADLRLAISEALWGFPPAQVVPFVVRRIGVPNALRLGLSGMRLDAETALRVGMVDEVVDDAEALTQRVEATITQVLRCAPHASRAAKALILAGYDLPLDAHLDLAAEQFARCLRHDESGEGMRAFLEKRKPSWVRDS